MKHAEQQPRSGYCLPVSVHDRQEGLVDKTTPRHGSLVTVLRGTHQILCVILRDWLIKAHVTEK